jgi:hypothetical protein
MWLIELNRKEGLSAQFLSPCGILSAELAGVSYTWSRPGVQAAWLERAAELLVLRHDTLRIINGAGPDTPVQEPTEAELKRTNSPVKPSWRGGEVKPLP